MASLFNRPAAPPRPLPRGEPPYDDSDEIDDGAAGKMSFLEHLDELRKRLIGSAIALGAGFLIALAFITPIFDFIMRPLYEKLPPDSHLIYTEPTEAFMLRLKIAALVGAMLAVPVIMWQLWLFISPGLYKHEKRFAVPFILMSTVFFAGGAVFSHYVVFPWAWVFLASFSTDYLLMMPKISSVFSLYAKMILAFGVIFEMPTVVFFLARMGLVTARFLARHLKYAVLIIFIAAAILTPTGDVVTQSLMAGPMFGLYLLSIGIAWVFGKRKPRDSQTGNA
ncbi:MAG: twin-arginine translocase subunit TatC [Acidobacteriota bacterium]